MIKIYITSLILSVLPVSELRGAIPYAYFNNVPIVLSYALGVLGNLLVIPGGLIFFSIVEKILNNFSFFQKFAQSKARKVEKSFSKYGYLGLTLFVAIPFPITGAWTALLGSWILGLDKKKSSLAIAAGVLIAGIIVSAVILTGSSLAFLFTKTIKI